MRTAPSRRHQAAISGPATGVPAGSAVHRPHRGERVHRPIESGGRHCSGIDGGDPVVGQHQQHVEIVEVLDDHRHDRRRTGRWLDQPDHHRPVVGPVDQAGGQMGGHQGTGHQGPTQLLEDQRGLGQPESRPRRPPRPGRG